MKRFSKSVSIGVECLEKRDLMAGSIDPVSSLGTIVIRGDDGLDDVARVSIVNGTTVRVTLGHRSTTGTFVLDAVRDESVNAVRKVTFFGERGDDLFRNDTGIESSALGGLDNDSLIGGSGRDFLNGGADDDVLSGRGGDDILLGRLGNDTMSGAAGRDILIGGGGADELHGGAGQDILIGGTTDHEINSNSLFAIQSEWLRPISYEGRIAHLTGAVGGGLNGTVFLRSTNQVTDTVHDDGVADRLFGEADRDWFFSRSAGEMPDRLIGPSFLGGETANSN